MSFGQCASEIIDICEMKSVGDRTAILFGNSFERAPEGKSKLVSFIRTRFMPVQIAPLSGSRQRDSEDYVG